MRFRSVYLLLGVLLLIHTSHQQNKKKLTGKKDSSDSQISAALEDLQQQMKEIMDDVNILKEQQALQTVCLKGVKIHGKCFLVDTVKKRYHTANEDCIAKGGILSTPLSAEENTQLYNYARHSLGPDAVIWLGVNDMQTEGVWMDQTGSAIRYKNWQATQPDGRTSENCAVLSGASGGKWQDENCREERASVCEFNIV
nr:tetranectin isoform X1 [Misgurnus anguillicaudatus]